MRSKLSTLLLSPERRDVTVVSVALTAIFFGLSLVGRAAGNWENMANHLIFHGWVLGWMLIATVALRSLGVVDLLRFWFFGYFGVALLVFVLGEPTEMLFGADSSLQTTFWIPVLEETAKVLPIVLLFIVFKRRFTSPTLSDVVVASFAVGAGLGFKEDLIRERVAADGFDWSFWGAAFPTSLYEETRFIATHSGWTVVAGVGLGVALMYRQRWSWAVALLGWLMAVLDHGAVNSSGAEGEGFNRAMLDGDIVAFALPIVIGAAVLHDVVLLRRIGVSDDRFVSWVRPASPVARGLWPALRYRRLLVGARVHAWLGNRSGRTADRSEVVEQLERFSLARARGRWPSRQAR